MNDTPSRAWWEQPIRFAKGVGPKRTSLLQRFGIETVEDALWTLPWRYEDRSVMTPIGQLVPGVQASICGTIIRSEAKTRPQSPPHHPRHCGGGFNRASPGGIL